MLLSVNLSNALALDFSVSNPDLAPDRVPPLDLTNTAVFTAYVFGKLRAAGAGVGIGGYNEHRVIYRRSEHFSGANPREIHLGVDIWAEAGTPIFCPQRRNRA